MDANKYPLGLTFDDVLLEPRESSVLRSEAVLETKLTRKIKLRLPIVSAAMDTVSGVQLAIELGRLGGIGILHRNCAVDEQVSMLRKVRKAGILAGAAVGKYRQYFSGGPEPRD